MTATKVEIRSGAYYDSVVLMQLQRALLDLPGVEDTGVVMATPANKELLAQSDLLTAEISAAAADDLVIVVRAADASAAGAALVQVDDLLTRRRSQTASDYRPKSLESAAKALPAAQWVLVSVPGRYAAGVARQALELGKHVFLYSDNVSLDDEISLKQNADQKGLLVMGPDCGTAIVNGIGLGFANRVRRGKIGLVGASGTGLQLVTARIHQLGGGITHALGTGGRDLSEPVGAITAHQELDLLARDPDTEVIVLISKPPAPAVAADLLAAARSAGKPVVVNFIGFQKTTENTEESSTEGTERTHFARTLDEAAALAVALTTNRNLPPPTAHPPPTIHHPPWAPSQRYLRGLFSGGTLAYEALFLLQEYLPTVYSNAPLKGGPKLENPHRSQGHTIVDLGEDEFTVGRLHPMLDNDLRIRRLHEEAADPETAVILIDMVLGDGAHPDPAGELAPAIARAIATASANDRVLVVVAIVVGTDEDPQDLAAQVEQLQEAGATVFLRHDEAVRAVGELLTTDPNRPFAIRHSPFAIRHSPIPNSQSLPTPVDLSTLTAPFAAINVGLESFAQSLSDQGAAVVHVDWRPPAGGNEKLMEILAKMKKKE